MERTSLSELANWIPQFEHLKTKSYPCPGFLKPYHLVTLGLALKEAGCTGIGITEKLKTYATRMQLWEAIGIEPPSPVNKYAAKGKFLPIQPFKKVDNHHTDTNSVISALVNQLTEMVEKNASDEHQNSLNICLTELVNNFYDHANSTDSLPCLICAQSWPKGGLIQIAIADLGIGIRNSLSENFELSCQLDNNNSCELASTYGITSKPNNSHAGYGLTLAKDLMALCGGSYILASGNELFSSTKEASNTQKMDYAWNGTLVVLEWEIKNQLNTKRVYDSWPLPPGFDKDDYF